MKKIEITLFVIILALLMSCRNQEVRKFPDVKKLSEYKNTNFLPTLEHAIDEQNNSVYCATLLYAWEKVRKIIGLPLVISQEDTDLLLLNNSKSFINVLKANEYSASGTVDGDLITAKAEFSKSLPFEIKLDSYDKRLNFKGEPVASFGVGGYSDYKQRNNVQIIYYKDDDNFIIELLPKDKKHEIILFKTDKVFQSMAEMNKEILKLTEIGNNERENEKLEWKYWLNSEDIVIIPKINFNIETNYSNLERKNFNTTDQNYKTETVWQRTAFILDENGAEIESEAETVTMCAIIEEEKEKPKNMIFDKNFLILLKRTDSQNPYFGLWVTNTELLIKE